LDIRDALAQVRQLSESLRRINEKDPEQEVLGMAIPVVDAVLQAAREHLSVGDPLLAAVRDVMSPETVTHGEPVRVLEVLLVVEQLQIRLSRIASDTDEPLRITREPGPFD
jgi:hypothetical protein